MSLKTAIAAAKPSRPGDHIMITIPHYWGRGATAAEAFKKLQQAGGVPRDHWRIHSVHPETYVENVQGWISHPTDHPPIMLAEANPPARR